MRGKKRPLNERAHAVGIAVVAGIAEASRQTGIPQPTIHAWFHSPESEELRVRNKGVILEEWRVGVQLGFRRSVELLDKTDDPVKAATAAAILFDKMAVWGGEATTRSEVTHFRDYNDDERRQISDALDRVLTGTVQDVDSAEVRQSATEGLLLEQGD